MLAGLTWQGIVALLVEGVTDQVIIETVVTEVLAPQLQPGQIVVGANRCAIMSPQARQAIADRGCELRVLLSFSSDFIPIAQTFSSLKSYLQRAEARMQTRL